MYGEIDFLKLLEDREESERRVQELRKQCDEDRKILDEKYRDILDMYCPALAELNSLIDRFNQHWDIIMKPYRKEQKALKRKYKDLAKEL